MYKTGENINLKNGERNFLKKGNRISAQYNFIIVCVLLYNLQHTLFISNVYSFIQ